MPAGRPAGEVGRQGSAWSGFHFYCRSFSFLAFLTLGFAMAAPLEGVSARASIFLIAPAFSSAPAALALAAAVTERVTLGTSSILFGMALVVGLSASGIKAILCLIFLLLTSPVAAHALARGAYKAGVKLCDESVVDEYKKAKKYSWENAVMAFYENLISI